MKKYLILILIIVVVLSSCKKYETQYGTETAATALLLGDVYEIAYGTEVGVFLINAKMDRSKMLISFANKINPKAGRVALSLNRDKVAYVDPDNGIPIIVDTLGNVLAQLTQYPDTKDLGWHNGDSTLYILSNNQVHFYGEALDLPNPLFITPSNANNYEVTTIDINKDLDVAYGTAYYVRHSNGSKRSWYNSYNINYKLPSFTDESNVELSTTYYTSQNVLADSSTYYHTVRFFSVEYSRPGRRTVTIATANKKQFNIDFNSNYGFSSLQLDVFINKDGALHKNVNFNSENLYVSTFYSWTIDLPYNEAPFYIDWAVIY